MFLKGHQDEIGSQDARRDPSVNTMRSAGVKEQRIRAGCVRCCLRGEDIPFRLFERGIQHDRLFAQRDRERSSGKMDLGGCHLLMFQGDGFIERETGAIEQPPHELIADWKF